jgi:hypothetical protein
VDHPAVVDILQVLVLVVDMEIDLVSHLTAVDFYTADPFVDYKDEVAEPILVAVQDLDTIVEEVAAAAAAVVVVAAVAAVDHNY